MPVFDFSNTTEERKACECTYTTFQSNENTASAKYPILVLDMPCIRSVKLHLAVEKSFPRKMAFYSL